MLKFRKYNWLKFGVDKNEWINFDSANGVNILFNVYASKNVEK